MEKPCDTETAPGMAKEALLKGASGAVTSWGSGIKHRLTLRTFWDAENPAVVEALGADFLKAEDLVEEDWSRYWRETLKSFKAGRRFVLAPAWDDTPASPGETKILIDPGMAFGAGDHPTTRLSAAMIEELASDGERGPMLDVGAGTGVLALVAAASGISPVDALDIDPFCFAACGRNARLNRLSDKVRPLLLSLDLLEGSYPLAVANVAPVQLIGSAALLAGKVSSGGYLLLSGFEEEMEERLVRAFEPGFSLVRRDAEEGWVALLMKRQPGEAVENG